jgi:hypothetical protein
MISAETIMKSYSGKLVQGVGLILLAVLITLCFCSCTTATYSALFYRGRAYGGTDLEDFFGDFGDAFVGVPASVLTGDLAGQELFAFIIVPFAVVLLVLIGLSVLISLLRKADPRQRQESV